ncbi:reverse transcriptase domain-containing protein [Tanacetum coccineum]
MSASRSPHYQRESLAEVIKARGRPPSCMVLMEDARDDRSELEAPRKKKGVNLLYRDRPIHHHLAVMVEREAWMAREAWGFSMDVSDDARSHVLALRTTVVEQRALISGLQAADHQRQVQLTMALQLLKGLQTQMAEFQRQQGPAEGPAQPDAPEEADSKLVANQVNGTYIAKEIDMVKYLEKVKALTNTFRAFSIKQVPRSKNKKADALSKMASTSLHISGKQITKARVALQAGTRSLPVAKALRTGYYWPTMHKDARALIKACQECQVHKPVPRNPQEKLNPITSPWPFYKWGIDIAGPFPEGPGKVKFLIVAMDYFTKWIEAKPVATITGSQVKKFVWENIVCRFGLPGEIISDNGKQFRDNPFKDWCEKLCIQQHFASVKHPQTNGLVERANIEFGEGNKEQD